MKTKHTLWAALAAACVSMFPLLTACSPGTTGAGPGVRPGTTVCTRAQFDAAQGIARRAATGAGEAVGAPEAAVPETFARGARPTDLSGPPLVGVSGATIPRAPWSAEVLAGGVMAAPRVRAYRVGRSVDPDDPRLMHEAHLVYRIEEDATWQLEGSQPTGPTPGAEQRPEPARQATAAEEGTNADAGPRRETAPAAR